MAALRWFAVALVLVGCDVGELQPDGGSASTCLVVDGVPLARVSAGPDGWCDYDGHTCACHGHGIGDRCAEAIADFEDCTKGAQ